MFLYLVRCPTLDATFHLYSPSAGSETDWKGVARPGVAVTDLHRESVDHITIPSQRPDQPPLRCRVAYLLGDGVEL
eukprot:3205322-Rhodomonas_salina.1